MKGLKGIRREGTLNPSRVLTSESRERGGYLGEITDVGPEKITEPQKLADLFNRLGGFGFPDYLKFVKPGNDALGGETETQV